MRPTKTPASSLVPLALFGGVTSLERPPGTTVTWARHGETIPRCGSSPGGRFLDFLGPGTDCPGGRDDDGLSTRKGGEEPSVRNPSSTGRQQSSRDAFSGLVQRPFLGALFFGPFFLREARHSLVRKFFRQSARQPLASPLTALFRRQLLMHCIFALFFLPLHWALQFGFAPGLFSRQPFLQARNLSQGPCAPTTCSLGKIALLGICILVLPIHLPPG